MSYRTGRTVYTQPTTTKYRKLERLRFEFIGDDIVVRIGQEREVVSRALFSELLEQLGTCCDETKEEF